MTYNFDPDRWLDNELAALDHARCQQKMTDAEYENRHAALMARYDAMLERLDGTYQLPSEMNPTCRGAPVRSLPPSGVGPSPTEKASLVRHQNRKPAYIRPFLGGLD